MAARPIKVAFVGDHRDLEKSLDRAEAAMDSTAATARSSSDKIDRAFAGTADAADGVASASSQTAGGIGDLAGALEATGLISESTAQSMETVSASIMGATGAADLLNVATEKMPGLQKIATKATNGLAKAKRALGIAVRFALGPIGLIIAGVALLVGGIVLLYKKNETFRRLVDKVWAGIKRAFQAVFDYLRDKVPPIWDKLRAAAVKVGQKIADVVGRIRDRFADFRDRFAAVKDRVVDYAGAIRDRFEAIRAKIAEVVERIRDRFAAMREGFSALRDRVGEIGQAIRDRFTAIRDRFAEVVEGVRGKVDAFVGFFRDLPGRIRTATAGMWNGIRDSFRGALNSIIGWWNDLTFTIDLPDALPGLPDSITINTPNLPTIGGSAGRSATRPTSDPETPLAGRYGMGGNTYKINATFGPGTNPVEAGRAIVRMIDDYERAGGRRRAY